MDPLSPIALGLGAASLAIQAVHSIKIGYGYFEVASSMDEACAILKTRLRMNYVRLVEWSEAVGLTSEESHAGYDRKMRANRALVYAILGEIHSIQQRVSKLALDGYEQLKWENIELPVEGQETLITSPDSDRAIGDITTTTSPQGAGDTNGSNDASSSFLSFRNGQASVEIDLSQYSQKFLSQSVEKHHSGRVIKSLVKFGQDAKKIIKEPKRLKWALKDKEKVEEHLKRLSQLTEYLHESLGDFERRAVLDNTQAILQMMLQLSTSVNESKSLLLAIQAETDSKSFVSSGTTLVDSQTRTEDPDVRPAEQRDLYERFTKFSIAVATTKMDDKQGELPSPKGEKLKVGASIDDDHKSLAAFEGRKVWIEWKLFEPRYVHVGGGDMKRVPDGDTEARVKRLVQLLQMDVRPQEFCVPNCLGYITELSDESSRFGFVYEAPENLVDEYKLLSELFEGDAPSLASRLALAQQLSVCLLFMHSVNWLHKGLRSNSVVFYGKPKDRELGRFCIGGLEYARPDDTDQTTTGPPQTADWGIYCHPDYLGDGRAAGFKKTYDMYSLGIMLIEIAYWRRLSEIPEVFASITIVPGKDPSLKDLRKISESLLLPESLVLKGVKLAMGQRYHDAVRRCLEGLVAFGLPKNAPQNHPAIGALLNQAFLNTVVGTLNSIVV